MGARTKLNQAYVIGTLLTAATLGGLAGSWLVFAAVTGIGLAMNYISGDIRARK